jgi:type II restriction/modification system DNA methylase subunit YeeA
VDFIVGNPPFLGGKFLRRELDDDYVNQLFSVWKERVPAEVDLCCYWFEKARAHIQAGRCWRAGLLATQGIRGGANREVLKKIQDTGGIFWAISDKEWILDGANVHVSLIGFDDGSEKTRVLDGTPVSTINANLSTATDITQARILPENQGIAFMGDTKVGPFEIPEALAREWLPLRNPNGKSNADVVRPWANGLEVTRTPQRLWIVDFPPGMSEAEAAQYEKPFEYIKEKVRPIRAENNRQAYAERWWIHAEARPEMRRTLNGLSRFLVTPTIAKHRIFAWLDQHVLPDHALIVFARADDYFFGVLHSRPHEVWALTLGTRLETRPRYTPTTCFETFPFPKPTPSQEQAIAEAARALEAERQNWLGDRSDKKRTLTALYNQRPTWLIDAHAKLDTAVCAAYGWDPSIDNDEILRELLGLNALRSTPLSPASA